MHVKPGITLHSFSGVKCDFTATRAETPMTGTYRFKKECDKVWKEAQQLSIAESSQASMTGERNSLNDASSSSSSEVDIKAAARACRNAEVPRR